MPCSAGRWPILWLLLLLCGCGHLGSVPAPAQARTNQTTREGASSAGAEAPVAAGTIEVGQSISIVPPDAYTCLVFDNLGNSTTTALLTAGGELPAVLTLPPETNTPVLFIDDFSPGNLNVANQMGSPIRVQLLGIGVGASAPAALPFGERLSLAPGYTAQTVSNPNWMNLSLSTTANALTTFVIFGGTTPSAPQTTRAVVIQLNAAAAFGPVSGTFFDNSGPQPTGSSLQQEASILYATTTGATYNLLYNWGASTILIANLSASTAAAAGVTLTSLG